MPEDYHGLIALPSPKPSPYSPQRYRLEGLKSQAGGLPAISSGLAMGGPSLAQGLGLLGQALGGGAAGEAADPDQARLEALKAGTEDYLQDRRPEKLAGLESEIEAAWAGPAHEGARGAAYDLLFGNIGRKLAEEGELPEAEALLESRGHLMNPETLKSLKGFLAHQGRVVQAGQKGLDRIWPDLYRNQEAAVLSGRRPSPALDRLLDQAASRGGLDPADRAEMAGGQRLAGQVRAWLDEPDRAFMSFPQLEAEKEKWLAGRPEAEREKLGRILKNEIDLKRKLFEDDPIAAVAEQCDLALKRLIKSGALDPDDEAGLVQTKTALSRALVKDMGLTGSDLVLSRGDLEDLTNELAGRTDPDGRLELLAGYQRRFGRYADRAFKQLDIPPAERLDARLYKKEAPQVKKAARLALKNLGRKVDPKDAAGLETVAAAHREMGRSAYGRALKDRLFSGGQEAWAELAGFYDLGAAVALGAGQAGRDPLAAVRLAASNLEVG